MITALTIAHLSDVHLGPIRGFEPRYWTLKRLSGYWNWQRRRRTQHLRHVLDSLVADLQAQAPDHIVVTGDLANIGLPQEHIDALGWLESLGPPDRVSVIPGNHDIYARQIYARQPDPGTRRWSAYMASDLEGKLHLESGREAEFPFVRRLRGLALIGLNSALPTPPLIAAGRAGRAQLAALASLLDSTGRAGLFRLVCIHHPPLPGQASRTRGLKDAAALQAVLHRCGAELVIHGHNHTNTLVLQPSSRGRPIPIVGVASASLAKRRGHEPLARYNLYRIEGPPWRIDLIGRGLADAAGEIGEIERRTLADA
jgi:3',5'-cyclic AMP phosphodiesterase CpdA